MHIVNACAVCVTPRSIRKRVWIVASSCYAPVKNIKFRLPSFKQDLIEHFRKICRSKETITWMAFVLCYSDWDPNSCHSLAYFHRRASLQTKANCATFLDPLCFCCPCFVSWNYEMFPPELLHSLFLTSSISTELLYMWRFTMGK